MRMRAKSSTAPRSPRRCSPRCGSSGSSGSIRPRLSSSRRSVVGQRLRARGRPAARRPQGRQAPADRRQHRAGGQRKAAQGDPALIPALDAVSEKLTTDELIKLNASVDIDRKSATDVASAWVKANKVGDGLQKGSGKVVVGASNFTESQILANIYADVLKSAGFDATVQASATATSTSRPSRAGDIQAFPEYLATVTEALNTEVNGPNATPSRAVTSTRPLAAAKPLARSGPDVRDAVEGDRPERLRRHQGVRRQAQGHDADPARGGCGGGLVLGGPPECPTRPFCQPGLEKTYGMEFASFKQLDAGGPLTKTALKQGQVSIGLIFSSDGSLAQQKGPLDGPRA